ncbi:MAG: IclR family transcriptional regulator [Betaproteobacteria bacterium]|nr:IclR family transcriptional regulator [Betaproteobacteria bacterium]
MPTMPKPGRSVPSSPEDSPGRTSRGIQSVEVGGQLLKALVRSGQRMALKDLAREADMSPAKAHPYLVSFGKLGLIEQDPVSGHYGLGQLAVQLGLISLQQVDPVRLAIAELPALAQALGVTVSAAVWGGSGPIIVRVEEGPRAVNVSMRHGIPASLRHTGTGKVFAAYMPPEVVRAALAAQGEPQAWDDVAFHCELVRIRDLGLSQVREELISGISAMAAPVFDGFGRLALVIAAMGPSAQLDLTPEGYQASLLREVARRVSLRLGAPTRTP